MLSVVLKQSGFYLELFNHILSSGVVPREFLRCKVVVVKKPGKEGTKASHFRPTSLMNQVFKLLERLILNRIPPRIDVFPASQAGFRSGSSYCEQVVMALYIFFSIFFKWFPSFKIRNEARNRASFCGSRGPNRIGTANNLIIFALYEQKRMGQIPTYYYKTRDSS